MPKASFGVRRLDAAFFKALSSQRTPKRFAQTDRKQRTRTAYLSASSRRYGDEKQEKSWFRQDEAVKVKGSGAG